MQVQPPQPFSTKSHWIRNAATHNIPRNVVMQQSQGSGSLPASGTNQFVSGTATASGSNSFGPNIPDTHPARSSTVANPTTYWLPNRPSFPPYTPTTLPRPQLLRTRSKKRTHKAAKTPLTSTSTVTLGPKNGRLQKALKSKAWIDTYFKNGKVCKLCGRGCKKGRIDWFLGHLVSVHFIQVIKNRTEYDAQRFAEEADLQPHFIATQTAFEYTRRFVNVVKCSLCLDDTSLILRTANIWDHLRRAHAETTIAIHQEEGRHTIIGQSVGIKTDVIQLFNVALAPSALRTLSRLAQAVILKLEGIPEAGSKADEYAEVWDQRDVPLEFSMLTLEGEQFKLGARIISFNRI
ncbi:hypothetical protein Clacol_007119 [Clathrus columnatus]|uniref:BED-type domain-containing protein n=1 Tax=Clathrus columnatus TaxID=1419009 RepID=A0AAV5AHA2_9AGAM|nr:hypothetical protein Clacol_007119 [Clathrus columnatus]